MKARLQRAKGYWMDIRRPPDYAQADADFWGGLRRIGLATLAVSKPKRDCHLPYASAVYLALRSRSETCGPRFETMFSRFLKSSAKVAAPAAPSTPDDTAVWAIGDIHGRLDLLEPLIESVLADADMQRVGRKVVVFLGDYIDRGPDSRGVIQFLLSIPLDREIEWRFLKGNHEETMLRFLDDSTVGEQWCQYGGGATLRSFGLSVPQMRHKPETWSHLSADLNHKLSAKERTFLDGLELSIEIGDYFFSHAGARPGRALSQQSADDLMWIRRTFLDSQVEFERVVVHGHTPSLKVHSDRRRLGIDTKAYESGVLTAVRLVGAGRDLVQAHGQGSATEPAGSVAKPAIIRQSLISA
jgi:serine/threonine protein phosphatase 1